ncbi:MAG: hypothetical protein RLZZ576_721 [Actinomycetota bacterium]|jgi:uncharacterized OsmC-like protein
MTSEMMTFEVTATRNDSSGSTVRSKNAELTIDTSMAGRLDALNPVELLLSSLSACLIKGIERVAETLGIEYESVDVALTAHRPVDDARIEDIHYLIRIETEANQNKLELLHKNLMKFGTIYNTVKSGTRLSGEIRTF